MAKGLPRAKATSDYELQAIGRIADILATLNKAARRRVLTYLNERADSLPVLAQVEADEDSTNAEPFLFPGHERQHAEA